MNKNEYGKQNYYKYNRIPFSSEFSKLCSSLKKNIITLSDMVLNVWKKLFETGIYKYEKVKGHKTGEVSVLHSNG